MSEKKLKPCPFHNFPCANCTQPLFKKIAELENELEEQARVNGAGASREARLLARVTELETLLPYCTHYDSCKFWVKGAHDQCSCGFSKVREVLGAK